jgi:cytochrome c oxidase subunit 2
MIRIIQNKQTRRFNLEGQIIESIWTIAPAVILVFIAIPSLRLLNLIDEIHNPIITLKQLDTNDTEVMNTETSHCRGIALLCF